MKVFKTNEIRSEYSVSHTTVAAWIKKAAQEQNDLEIVKQNGKSFIVDSLHNREVLRKLSDRAFRHSWTANEVDTKPKSEISKVLTNQQLSEIYASLSSKNEVPYKYTYLDIGAEFWSKHFKISQDNSDRVVYKEKLLINENLDFILGKLQRFKKISIFDIGAGNGVPAIPFIKAVQKAQKTCFYTALDISPSMLALNQENLKDIVGEQYYANQIIDIERDVFAESLLKNKDAETANLLLFLGATLGNQNQATRVYLNLRDSMSKNDFMLIGVGLEAEEVKQTISKPHNEFHLNRSTWLLDILGFEGCYSKDIVDIYNPIKGEYLRKILFTKMVNATIPINGQEHKLIFEEGDTVLVSRFRRFREKELLGDLTDYGFALNVFVTSEDSGYALALVSGKRP